MPDPPAAHQQLSKLCDLQMQQQEQHPVLAPAPAPTSQAAPPEGSLLFSYVQTDDFCERFEASRCVTTSKWEGLNHLARKLATDARNRQKVRRSQMVM